MYISFFSSPPPLYYRTNECTNCGISFAEYHCPKCNIWMALNKRPFHCDECGKFLLVCCCCCCCFSLLAHAYEEWLVYLYLARQKKYTSTLRSSFSLFINSPSLFFRLYYKGFCRVGGQENFRHCSECSMCISVTVYDTHNW